MLILNCILKGIHFTLGLGRVYEGCTSSNCGGVYRGFVFNNP